MKIPCMAQYHEICLFLEHRVTYAMMHVKFNNHKILISYSLWKGHGEMKISPWKKKNFCRYLRSGKTHTFQNWVPFLLSTDVCINWPLLFTSAWGVKERQACLNWQSLEYWLVYKPLSVYSLHCLLFLAGQLFYKQWKAFRWSSQRRIAKKCTF